MMDDGGPCSCLTPKELRTLSGTVRYWISPHREDAPYLVFLPGLTADHRLFEAQIAYFASKANCFVWDPPSHGASRPYDLVWSLDDKSYLLHEILAEEGFAYPILIGQSMGGFLAQVYMEIFPGEVSGFVAIDSAPLKMKYYADWELSFLRHTRALYAPIPWRFLLNMGSTGVSETEHGQALMRDMMSSFTKDDYVDLVSHGYKAIATAIESERRFKVCCPAIIICGTRDAAGFTKRLSRHWSQKTNIPLHWIEGAGHNANVDCPDVVNAAIDAFLDGLEEE